MRVAAGVLIVVAFTGCDLLFDIHRFDPSATTGDGGGTEDGLDLGDAALADAADCGSHDEDHDGTPDTCDRCPTVASSDVTDTDGDGVPEVCDPSPTRAGNSIDRFYPFADNVGWAGSGTFAADALTIAPNQMPVTTKVFVNPVEIATQIEGLVGTNTDFQIVLGIDPNSRLLCQVGTFCVNGGTTCVAIYQGMSQAATKDLSIAASAVKSVILWRDGTGIVKCSVNDRTAAHTVSYAAATTMPDAAVALLAPTGPFTADSVIVYAGP